MMEALSPEWKKGATALFFSSVFVMLRHGRWVEKVVGLVMIILLDLMSVIIPEFDFDFRS